MAAVPETCRLAAGGVAAGGGVCAVGVATSPLPPPQPATSKATAPAAMDFVSEWNFMLVEMGVAYICPGEGGALICIKKHLTQIRPRASAKSCAHTIPQLRYGATGV